MNLIQARNSGKMFKRKDSGCYGDRVDDLYDIEGQMYVPYIFLGKDDLYPLLAEDILAEDWEVKE